jgi:hypothetical protein
MPKSGGLKICHNDAVLIREEVERYTTHTNDGKRKPLPREVVTEIKDIAAESAEFHEYGTDFGWCGGLAVRERR